MSDIDIDDVRRLDGRLLLVFRELLRRRSVTATAGVLSLSQSAVSHALGRLRVMHDDQLFTRRPHGLVPTRRAEELGPIVEQLIETAALLYASTDEWEPATATRRFDIAAPEFVVAALGADLLSRWSTTAPGVSLSTYQLDHDEVTRRLTRGDLDLAVGRFRARQPAALHREVLYTDTYCVVAALDHRRAAGPLSLDDYRALGHVIAGSASEGDEHETIPSELRVRAIVPGWMTALTMVSRGDGIATCPRRLAEHHAEDLGLQILEVPGKAFEIDVSLLRRAFDPPPAVAWLIAELRLAAGQPAVVS